MPNIPLSFLDEIQTEISRLNTLSTCLEMAGATDYLKNVNELRGLMLDQCDTIHTKLGQCFPATHNPQGDAQ